MPNTFMAVAMDLPDDTSPYGSVHPRDKQDVGARLMIGALKFAYNLHYNPDGPVILSAARTGDGHIVLTYPNDQVLVVNEPGDFKVRKLCGFLTRWHIFVTQLLFYVGKLCPDIFRCYGFSLGT